MTKDSELSFLFNLALRVTKVVANINISNRVAFYADDMVVMGLFHRFIPLNLIMEMDGVNNCSVGEEIELSIECYFVGWEVVFFEE